MVASVICTVTYLLESLTTARGLPDLTRSFSSGSIQTLFNPPPSKLAASLFWLFRLIENSPLPCRYPRLQRPRLFLPSSPHPSVLTKPSPPQQEVPQSLLVPPPFQGLQCGSSGPSPL